MANRPSLLQESTNENRFLVICCSSGWNNWTTKALKIIATGVEIGPNVVGEITYIQVSSATAKCHRYQIYLRYWKVRVKILGNHTVSVVEWGSFGVNYTNFYEVVS